MEHPSVTQVLSQYSDYSKIRDDVLCSAMERGTDVHKACAAYAANHFCVIPRHLHGYFKSFTRWYDKYVLKSLWVEHRGTNIQWGYTGGPDLVVLMADQIATLIDLKTAAQPQSLWSLQVAAYANLPEIQALKPKKFGTLQPRKDGSEDRFIEIENTNQKFSVFLSMLNVYRFLNSK